MYWHLLSTVLVLFLLLKQASLVIAEVWQNPSMCYIFLTCSMSINTSLSDLVLSYCCDTKWGYPALEKSPGIIIAA